MYLTISLTGTTKTAMIPLQIKATAKIGARIIMTTNTTGVIRIETAVSFIFIVL
jgi:hypothetical protein